LKNLSTSWAVISRRDEEEQERRYYQGPSERISLNQRPNTWLHLNLYFV